MEMTERQRALAGVKEAAERKPLDFWSAVGAVMVGNLLFGLLVWIAWSALHLL